MTLESFSNQFPSIEDSHVLSEEEQERIEGGSACESGCKKACYPGGKKGDTTIQIGTSVTPEIP